LAISAIPASTEGEDENDDENDDDSGGTNAAPNRYALSGCQARAYNKRPEKTSIEI